MTLDEYQTSATRTINARLDSKEQMLDAAAGLAEEAGEILGVIRKHAFQARDLNREQLKLELGDALWCLAVTARSAGFALDEIAAANLAKLQGRYPTGYADAATREHRA